MANGLRVGCVKGFVRPSEDGASGGEGALPLGRHAEGEAMRNAKACRRWGVLGVAVAVLAAGPAYAQLINVTMRLNTATNRDTLRPNHVVQLRGEVVSGQVVPAPTWDANTGIVLHNAGGDYWEVTFKMAPGSQLKYKFWTGFNQTTGTFFWNGWEGPIRPADPVNSGGNRYFIAGQRDTVVALQFYNGSETEREQYWRPWQVKADSFVVYFRVNMAALMETREFNPDKDQVVVRGGRPLDPTNTWDVNFPLTREIGSADGGAMFSGAAYIHKDSVKGGEWQNYKFVVLRNGSEFWESRPNRYFRYSGPVDTTLNWVYFNDQKPTGGNVVEATVTWQVKTDGLEKLGVFSRTVGDRVVLDGARAWDINNPIVLNYVPLLKLWVAQETFIKAPGAQLEYKYVLLWDDSRANPSSPNYLRGLDLTPPIRYWEEPCVTGSGNRYYTYGSQTQQMVPGDYKFDWHYFNGLPPEGVIETPMDLTFNVDMTPATRQETNPSNPLFRPGLDTVWVQFMGCLMPLTQGDGIYNNKPIMLSDPDGDMIYSATIHLNPPFPFDVGYRVTYSTATGARIQNGGGFTKGRSYWQFIRPVAVHADGTIEWPSEYSLPVVPWKDSNLLVEDPPDLWTPTAVKDQTGSVPPVAFRLEQNYPNPFNPVTTIRYAVAKDSPVRIEVFNLRGERVRTLVDSRMTPGRYAVQWDGRDDHGRQLSSGVFLVKMVAGSFTQVRKVTLVK